MVGKGQLNLLIISFNWVNIKVVPMGGTCLVYSTLVPIKLDCILTGQDIYTYCDIDIQLVDATQHRDCSRRDRLVKHANLEGMSIGIEEAILLATAEDIKLHTSLFTQIVVDANRFYLTILQWSQIYMIPTSLDFR